MLSDPGSGAVVLRGSLCGTRRSDSRQSEKETATPCRVIDRYIAETDESSAT